MIEIVTSRSEVVQELITRVKQNQPGTNIEKGTPAYDLLVQHFADVISDERELISVATNIARVSPMFDENGDLLDEYADLDQHLTDRFFISRPEANEIYDTLYLMFTKKGNINIVAGSYVMYGNTQFTVQPTLISESSPLWKKVPGGYTHPVNIGTLVDDSVFIPVTSDWLTGAVLYDGAAGCFLIGAESRKVINTVIAPKVTFDYLRTSISNRSLSNPRSILYNIRNNTGFSPDQLNRARIMTTSEPAFVERRKVLFTDCSGRECSAIVSGDGKVMLDYGVGIYQARVDIEYVNRADPLYSELNPLIEASNPNNMVSEICVKDAKKVTGCITIKHEAGEDDEWSCTLTAYVTIKDPDEGVTLTTLSGSETFTGIDGTPASARIKLEDPDEVVEEGEEKTLRGWVTVHCTPDMFVTTYPDPDDPSTGEPATRDFEYYRDRFLLYRIDTAGLGVLSPISLGTEDDMTDVAAILSSIDPDYLLAAGTKAASGVPGSTLTVHCESEGIDCPIIEADFITGTRNTKNLLTITSDRIWWKFPTADRVQFSTDKTFMDRNQSYGTFTVTANGTTRCQITETFSINITTSGGIIPGTQGYFTIPSTFLRFDNRYLYFSVNPNGLPSTDNITAYLLYYGTDPDLMDRSQQLYLNHRLAEIGNRIIVSPFRPFVFTAYWAPEYVTQYMKEVPNMTTEEEERLDDLKSKFIELQAYLEQYFSDYQGKIGDIDFVEVAKGGQNETGLVLKRLDFTLFTQRGYPVRGWLDINLDQTCHLVWDDITDIIGSEVDDSVKFVTDERESNVTDETMYRPLFSRVGI